MGLYPTALARIIEVIKNDTCINQKSLCMLGRQVIHMNMQAYRNIIEIYGMDTEYLSLLNGNFMDSYSFFKKLGFEEVHAIDITNLEGADIIFDLNSILPEECYERFDYIINGGTLEHIFNTSNAMNNITQLLKKNGKMIHICPLAGYVDHGFYSFSPTFFVDFARNNGLFIDRLDIEFMMSKREWNYQKYDELMSVFSPDVRLFFSEKEDGYANELNTFIKQFEKMDNVGHIYLWCIAHRVDVLDSETPMQGYYQRQYTGGYNI